MQPDAAAAQLERRLSRWILLAAAGLWIAMAGPILLGRVYLADDLAAYHLPLRAFYSEQLKKGEPFDWLPNLYNGYYLTGEGQIGGYHPLHLALYRVLPLPAAFDLELLLSYPWMFAGTYLLLMRRIGSPSAALFGALVFTFSGFNLLHFIHPNAIAVVAHIPWLLWAIEVLLTSADFRRRAWMVAAIALLTGSQLLLGYPQYVWFSLVAEACYVASRYRAIVGPAWAGIARWLLGLALGLLVGGIQILPTMDALRDSTRATADADFAKTGSLAPQNLVQLIAPYLLQDRVFGGNTHELGLYIGAVPLLLCWWLFANRQSWGSLRPLILGATALGILGFLLALGDHSFLYPIQRQLPLVGAFRLPCRAIVLVHLAIALLATAAFALLVAPPKTELAIPPRIGGYWLLVGVSIAMAGLLSATMSESTGPPALVWAGPALFVLGAIALAAAEKGIHAGLPVLVVVAAADLGGYGLGYAIWPQTAPLAEFVGEVKASGERFHEGSIVCIADGGPSTTHVGNQLLLAGYRRADGYSGLQPARRLDLEHQIDQRLANVRWQTIRVSFPGFKPRTLWLPVNHPLPPIRFANFAIIDAGGLLPENEEWAHAALVDAPLDLPPGEPGTVDVVSERPGRFELSTQAPARRLLVVTEGFDRGWQARVDGQEVPVLRVNRDFLGCVVPAGEHRVELDFRAASLRRGAVATSLGLSLIGGMLALATWLGRKSPDPA